MKIATNTIGNYNPYVTNKMKVTNHQPKVEQTTKLTPKNDVNNIKGNEELSKEEKTFFAKLYPDQSEEVRNYQFYQRSGKMKSVSLGSLIDRRG